MYLQIIGQLHSSQNFRASSTEGTNYQKQKWLWEKPLHPEDLASNYYKTYIFDSQSFLSMSKKTIYGKNVLPYVNFQIVSLHFSSLGPSSFHWISSYNLFSVLTCISTLVWKYNCHDIWYIRNGCPCKLFD